ESGRSTISDRYSTVKPIASPNPGRTECRRRSRPPITTGPSPRLSPAIASARCRVPLLRLVDLVEDAAVAEVLGLGLGPATEDLVDGEQADLREVPRVLARPLGQPRPVVWLGRV